MLAIASAVALAFVSSALAQPSPLTPLAAEVGQPCVITWTPDPTGQWKQTNIQLMSGDNNNMVPVTTVTTLDTTSGAPATFTWTCPDVTLYSPVFFYQFSHAAEPNNLIWTTRWGIEGPNGETVPPPNPTQPTGAAIPWGTAQLKDLTKVKPAPSYIVGQSAAGGNGTAPPVVTATGSATASMSVASSTASSMATVTRSMSSVAASMTSSMSMNTTTSSSAAAGSGASVTKSQASILAGVVGAAFATVLTFA